MGTMSMDMAYGTLAPEAVLMVAAIAVLLAGSFLPRTKLGATTWLAIVGLLVSAITAVIGPGARHGAIFGGTFVVDDVSSAVRIIAPLATAVVLVIGRPEAAGNPRSSEIAVLLILTTLGVDMLAGATDLLVMVSGFVLASIPMYALIGVDREASAAEATMKTYLIGALNGVLLMVGATVLVGVGGVSSYAGLAAALGDSPRSAVAVGAGAVVVGLTFKVGAAPAHVWVPDACQSAARSVAAFITTVPKIGGLVALLRFTEVVPSTVRIGLLVAVLAAITMTVGTFAAYRQDDVRRMLGWSTVGQAGFMLLALTDPGRPDAQTALMVYLGAYTVSNLAAFAVVCAAPARESIDDWRGAAARQPVLVGALVVALLGIVGTPPTTIFLGKLAVFTFAWDRGLQWLAVIGAVLSVASLYYVLRWIGAAFSPAESGTGEGLSTPTRSLVGAVAITLAVLSVLLMVPLGRVWFGA